MDAGVIDRVTGDKIIGAIKYHVSAGDQLCQARGVSTFAKGDDFNVRIDLR